MEELSLLFDHASQFLGELTTQHGAGRHFLLTAEGERALGAHMTDWQTRGIPVSHHIGAPDDATQANGRGGGEAFYVQRVPMRDAGFLSALRAWFESRGMGVVTICRECVECWETLVRLPLEPSERFAMILAMKDASPEELIEWRKALIAASQVATQEQEKLTMAINDLWKNAATSLNTTFKKKRVVAH